MWRTTCQERKDSIAEVNLSSLCACLGAQRLPERARDSTTAHAGMPWTMRGG